MNLFPKIYDSLLAPIEWLKFGNIRRNLLLKADGDVLELGSGTGVNFPYYKRAKKVVAIEPDAAMRSKSNQQAKQADASIQILSAEGESLPFADDSFDTVVATLVFCTIPDPVQAIAEVRRVCKPEGRVLFFEHVRVDGPLLRHIQDWATPVWKRMCDGCHLNRDTLALIKKARLEVMRTDTHFMKIFFVIEAKNRK